VGYDAGREQAQVDAWFSGAGLDDDANDRPADDEPPSPRGLLPS
jgi:hypothetical protein